MSGKLQITGSTACPNDPALVKAYCEGRTLAAGSGSITYATGATGDEGSDTGLTWTADVVGSGITVNLVDPGEEDASLVVSVTGTHVTVSLATDENGDITSTAAEVDAAIDADAAATALVSPANTGASDGSGVVEAEFVRLSGSTYPGLATGEEAVAWAAGFASWAAEPTTDGGDRDCCDQLYGGGYTP